jgi:DDE superfamily endonuclease
MGEQAPYRNRKSYLSTNVLAACTFDLKFCYIYSGWEGSANDQRVLQDAMDRGGFEAPYSKYFLGDAGYVNKGTILTPFRNVKYHLKEQLGSEDPPENPKELWNLRHASLRNVIERIFGVLKKRFPILDTSRRFPLATQFRLVHALCAVHNFIRRWRTGDDMYDKLQEEEEKQKEREEREGREAGEEEDEEEEEEDEYEEEGDEYEEEGDEYEELVATDRQAITAQAMTAFRASSAKRMWRDYQQYKLVNS